MIHVSKSRLDAIGVSTVLDTAYFAVSKLAYVLRYGN